MCDCPGYFCRTVYIHCEFKNWTLFHLSITFANTVRFDVANLSVRPIIHDLLLVELFDVKIIVTLKCRLDVKKVIESGTI